MGFREDTGHTPLTVELCVCAPGRTGRWLWQISGFDFVVWIVTYVCTAFVSISVGLVVGVGLSCLLAVVQAQRVHSARLTHAADTEIYYYHRPPATTRSVTIPTGVVVYRLTRNYLRFHMSVCPQDFGLIFGAAEAWPKD